MSGIKNWKSLKMKRSSSSSADKLWQWWIHRTWNVRIGSGDKSGHVPYVLWVMLNPTESNPNKEDDTLKKCIVLTDFWGWNSLMIVHLYSFRTHSLAKLRDYGYPVGDQTDSVIREAVKGSAMCIAAWGPSAKHDREREVLDILTPHMPVHCLRLTATDRPYHPVFVPDDTVPIIYSPRRAVR